MEQRPTIIRMVATTATQNVGANLGEDIFMPFDGEGNYLNIDDLGDYEYLGFDGENYVYADGKGKKFFSKVGAGIKKGAQKVGQAGKWVGGKIKSLVTKWGAKIRERKDKRAAIKAERIEKAKTEAAAKAKAEAEKKNLPPAQTEALVKKETAKAVKAIEEKHAKIETAVTNAETAAYNKTMEATKDVEKAEQAANQAGLEVEGGYGISEDTTKEGFWKSMSKGGKIAIIGGGALLVTVVIIAIVKSKK